MNFTPIQLYIEAGVSVLQMKWYILSHLKSVLKMSVNILDGDIKMNIILLLYLKAGSFFQPVFLMD